MEDNNSVADSSSNNDESRDVGNFIKEIFGTKVIVRMKSKTAGKELSLNPATRLIDEINKEREGYIRDRFLKELLDKEESTHQYLKQVKRVARSICGPGMKLERLKKVREVIQRPLLQCFRPNSLIPIEFHEKSRGVAENVLAYKKRSKLVDYRPHEVPYVSVRLILEWKANMDSRPCNHGVCQNKSPSRPTVVSRYRKPTNDSQPTGQMKTTPKARMKVSRKLDFNPRDRLLSLTVKAIRDEFVLPMEFNAGRLKELKNSLLGQIQNLEDEDSGADATRANKTRHCCNSEGIPVCALKAIAKKLRGS